MHAISRNSTNIEANIFIVNKLLIKLDNKHVIEINNSKQYSKIQYITIYCSIQYSMGSNYKNFANSTIVKIYIIYFSIHVGRQYGHASIYY